MSREIRPEVLLAVVLACGAPPAHAIALPFAAGSGTGQSRDAPSLTLSNHDRYDVVITDSPGALPSRRRALVASLDAQTPAAAATTPRRAVSQAKPSSGAGGGQAAAAASPPEIPRTARSTTPPDIVDGGRQGQAGYVHFFLLDTPDGDEEIQVGIELADGRIAWSFPDTGVSVMPFIRSGSIQAAGRTWGVRHLYGLPPYPDPASMAALRAALWDRVSPLADARTPYCNPFLRSQSLCLSCLGFVQEVLFPGTKPGSPAMPVDFPRTRSRLYYTTDDLLLYLTGFHEINTAQERARRIEELSLPTYLKEELWMLVEAFDLKDVPGGGVDTSKLKNAADKPPVNRTYTRMPPQRKRL